MQDNWLIAVDLDGTLFHTDHEISPRTLATMHEVVRLGHTMLIVTGRSAHSALPKLRNIPEGIRLICSNGAYEYDRHRQVIAWANYLPAPRVSTLLQQVLEALPDASFGWETDTGLSYQPHFIGEAGGAHTLEQGGSNRVTEHQDVLKLYVRTPTQRGSELATTIQELVGDDVEVSSSGAPFAEVTGKGVNKGSALANMARMLGFDATRTMAFGDNNNDIPMLRWAGVPVAMGNALNDLKSIASMQTLSNAEDGVAHFLENRFSLREP